MTERRSTPVTAALLLALFAVPLLALGVQAFGDSWRAPALLPQDFGWRGFDVAFGSAGAGEAALSSLLVALATTAICLLVGWPAARVIARRRIVFRGVIAVLIALPLLMPPYLAGFGLTEWFIRLGIDGTAIGLVLSHVVLALPYAVLILIAGFSRPVDELDEMAATSGVGPLRRLIWVTVPSMRSPLAAAALLCFLVSWSQYGTSLAVGAGASTLPLVLVPFVRTDPQVGAALAVVFIVPAVVALALAARAGRSPL